MAVIRPITSEELYEVYEDGERHKKPWQNLVPQVDYLRYREFTIEHVCIVQVIE